MASKGLFTLDQLARHMKMARGTMALHCKAAGVNRRRREDSSELMPEYHKFTSEEAEKILAAAWAAKGRAQAKRMGIL